MKNFCASIHAVICCGVGVVSAGRTQKHELLISSLSNFSVVRGFYTQYFSSSDVSTIVKLYQHIDQGSERRKIIVPPCEPVPYELLSLVLDHEEIYELSATQQKVTLPSLLAKAETDSRILNKKIDCADHARFTQDKIFVASALFSAATYCRSRPIYSAFGAMVSVYAFCKTYQASLERLACNTERDALQRLVDDCRALSGTEAKKTADAQKIVITFPDAEAYVDESVNSLF